MKRWILISLSLLVLIGLLGGCAPIKGQPLGLNEPPELALFSPEEEALKQEAIDELEKAKGLTGGEVLFAEIQTIIDKLNKLIVLQEGGLAEEALALKKDIMAELEELVSAADAQGFYDLAAELKRVWEKINKLIEMEEVTPPPPVTTVPPEEEQPPPPVTEPPTTEEEPLPPPPVTVPPAGKELYIYSVKFLLGEAKSEKEGVKPANYLTAVNIHNFLEESFTVRKKAVIAVPQGQPGIVSVYEEFRMGPNWAVEVDGADISNLLGLPFPPKSFVKGFVVIESPQPLNVVAVYTSSTGGWAGGGFSMDIEYISPALLPSALAPTPTPTRTPTPTPAPTLRSTDNAYLLEQAIDDTLYTCIDDGTTAQLYKSTDGGYTWVQRMLPASPIVAIATSPDEANVVYVATTSAVYKSSTTGWTWGLPTIAVPAGHVISALDVVLGPVGGLYLLVIGTTAADVADVFTWNEADTPPIMWQNQGFNAAMVAAYPTTSGFDRVVAVAFAPDYSISQAVVAVGNETYSNYTAISVMSGGGWGGAIGNPVVPIKGSQPTLGDIAFPSDWSAKPTTGNSNFFFGINDTDVVYDRSGVYLFQGAAVPGASVVTNVSVPNRAQIVTLDVAGPVSKAVILAGGMKGTVIRSLDGGATWLLVSVTGSDYTYVVLASDFTTSGKAWALVRGTAGGLSLSTDYGDTWNQIWTP